MKCVDLYKFLAEQPAELTVTTDDGAILSIDVVYNTEGKALYINLSSCAPANTEDDGK